MPAVDATHISLISAFTALAASVLGPVVTLSVARRQFCASVLSTNRQKWIESVREGLAELVSLLAAAVVVRKRWHGHWDRGFGPTASDPALVEKIERVVRVQSRIRLLLNPLEPDHQELVRAIETAILRLQSDDAPDEDTEADARAITALAQPILKREWMRVKLGT